MNHQFHLWIDLKELNAGSLKRYLYNNVYSSFIYNSQRRKQPKCPSSDECINKM